MDHSTKELKIDLEVLEAIIYNAENTENKIPKLTVELEFQTGKQFEEFEKKYNPRPDDSCDVVNSDEEEDEIQTEPEPKGQKQISVADQYEVKHNEMLSKLEESIILKQYYNPQIQEIQKETNTRILIVPKKIKYFGHSYDDIEEASSRIYDIRSKLETCFIDKFGLELSESKYYKDKLKSVGISLAKKGQSFYFWYNRDTCNATEEQLQEAIQAATRKNAHSFYPLCSHSPLIHQSYLDLITKLNGSIFQKKLQKEMDDYHVEISESGKNLIIHYEIKEQLQIPQNQFKGLYKNFTYFFIDFKKQSKEEEVENIGEIEAALDRFKIFWQRNENLLAIAYHHKEEKILGKSKEEINGVNPKQEFLQQMNTIFQLNKGCQIVVPQSEDVGLQKGQIQLMPKKYTIDYKRFEHVWVFCPKNKREKILLEIIKQYILERKRQSESPKGKSSSFQMSGEFASKIEDSSFQGNSIQTQMSMMNMDQGEAQEKGEILPQEFKKTKLDLVKDYDIYIEDSLKEKKYSDKIEALQKKKTKIDDELIQFLKDKTKQDFRPFNVEIPDKYMQKVPDTGLITVFAKDQQKPKFYEKEPFKVKLLHRWKKPPGSGWLINVQKEYIKEENDKFILDSQNFEVIKYLHQKD